MYEVMTRVRYHGSILHAHGDDYWITGYCHDDARYVLDGEQIIRHVRPWHITALGEPEGVALAITMDHHGHLDLDEVRLPADGGSLPVMREVLDCARVDVVALTDRLDMWINEEGIYETPVNPAATALAQRFGKTRQPYHGPVLLARADEEGQTANLTHDQVRALLVQLDDITTQ